MKILVALLVLSALALLGSRLSRAWAREHSPALVLAASGGGYLLLGMLLGPMAANLLNYDVAERLLPLVGFGLGWIGSLIGTQFRFPLLARVPGRMYLAAAGLAAAVAGAVAAGLYLIPGLPLGRLDRLVLVAAAVPLSVAVFGYAARRMPDPESCSGLLVLAGLADVLPLLVALGLPLLNMTNAADSSIAASALAVAGVGLGAGITLSLLLGTSEPRRDQFLLLVGVITLWAGFATYFQFSPLGTGLLAGFVFVNVGRRTRSWSISTLGRFERPIYMGVLLLSGALLQPVPLGLAAACVAVFVVARTLAVAGVGKLLERVPDLPLPAHGLPTVLLPQGALGLAVLVEVRLLFPDWIDPLVMTTAVVAFALFELTAPLAVARLTRQAHKAGGLVGTGSP